MLQLFYLFIADTNRKELAPTENSLEHINGPQGSVTIGLIVAAFVVLILLAVILVWAINNLRRREVVGGVGGIVMRDIPRNITHENPYCTVE